MVSAPGAPSPDIVVRAEASGVAFKRVSPQSQAIVTKGEMAKILSVSARAGVAKVLDPVGAWLVRHGISANAVTLVGTGAVVAGAAFLVTRGHLLAGLVVITISVFTDLLDGSMARTSGKPNRFGALLDSTMDRVADGAILGCLAYWLAASGQTGSATACVISLVAAQAISYVKARAEGLGATCDVGFAERAERLIILGVGALLWLLGVPYALAIALWILAVATVVTVVHRIWHVRGQLNGEAP